MSLFQVNKKQKFNRLFIVLNIATLKRCNEFKYPTIVVGLWGRIYSRGEAIPRHQLLCPKFYERIEGGGGETKAQIALGSKPAFLLLEPQKDSDISLLAIGPKTFWPFSPISINMQPCHPSQTAFSNNLNDQTFYHKCSLGQGN